MILHLVFWCPFSFSLDLKFLCFVLCWSCASVFTAHGRSSAESTPVRNFCSCVLGSSVLVRFQSRSVNWLPVPFLLDNSSPPVLRFAADALHSVRLNLLHSCRLPLGRCCHCRCTILPVVHMLGSAPDSSQCAVSPVAPKPFFFFV
jgi:hypothetical protein